MKYVDEFRDALAVHRLAKTIGQTAHHSWNIMEVCGGQTHSIVRYGLDRLLPPEITLIHGPGCPVCVTPIELIQKVIDHMMKQRFGRIVNITSMSVKMPVPGLDLSSGARAGLTAFLAGVARTVADHNVTINNLLPGYIATDRMWGVIEASAQAAGKTRDSFQQAFFDKVGAKRPGEPS